MVLLLLPKIREVGVPRLCGRKVREDGLLLVADLHQSVKSLWQDSSCMFQLASA